VPRRKVSALEGQQAPPAAAAVTLPAGASALKLPVFWLESPELWFTQINCIFATRGLTGSFDKFCHAVAALQHDALLLIADILQSLPEDLFATLQARLLASHRLMDYQRAEKLVTMLALGAWQPSQLMAAMLEMCPAGDEKSKIFPALFLQRLPQQLHILLTKQDPRDLVALAEFADELWSHQQQAHSRGGGLGSG
jgi:hypothetical protein